LICKAANIVSEDSATLVADIGGTNARFAIARRLDASGFTLSNQRRMKSADYARLGDAVRAYLDGCGCGDDVVLACFGVAGPVQDGEVRLTNSPWRFDPAALARELGLERIKVVNDFAALARGAGLLPAEDLVTIAAGTPDPAAPVVVLGPGTGLGVGLLIPTEAGAHIVSTEGGHALFAPRDPRERIVAERLTRTYGYLSSERVLSGAGLADIYGVLAEEAGASAARLAPEQVTDAALDKRDPIAEAAVETFCNALGGFAGDAAVITGARGGVFLGGGILPRIVDLLRASDFVARFRDKGPMSAYVANVPVRLIVGDSAALLGAAAFAADR
jgi:glucokinase